MLLGYAHVSRLDNQDTAPQAALLRAAGCRRVVEERASGGRWDRPALHRLLGDLREGDTLVVWKLGRLSRSLKDTLALLERSRRPRRRGRGSARSPRRSTHPGPRGA